MVGDTGRSNFCPHVAYFQRGSLLRASQQITCVSVVTGTAKHRLQMLGVFGPQSVTPEVVDEPHQVPSVSHRAEILSADVSAVPLRISLLHPQP